MNITVPVLSDYHNLFIAGDINKYSQRVAASISYKYRNPLTSFFANASLTYNYMRSSFMSNQLFIEDFIISTYAEKLSGSNFWSINGGISKGLGHSRMVVGCEASASTSSAASMRDNAPCDYRQQTVSVKPYFRGSILRWLSLNYDANYGFSRLAVGDITNHNHSFNQKLYASIIPEDRWEFSIGAEHFLTRFSEGNTENLILLDASAVWRLNSKIRLSLTANNLLNSAITNMPHTEPYRVRNTHSKSAHATSSPLSNTGFKKFIVYGLWLMVDGLNSQNKRIRNFP